MILWPSPYLKQALYLLIIISLFSCEDQKVLHNTEAATLSEQPYILVLGIAQDAGYPHIGCQRECCQAFYAGERSKKQVCSLGIVDPVSQEKWMLEASPDFTHQVKILADELSEATDIPQGIFLTHAHIGHYTGLMMLGREALGGNSVPVYVMPRMKTFLEQNGPWSQLVDLKNIQTIPLKADSSIKLNERISIKPILVPHRDEFSETVGFRIEGPKQNALFIPDIDKWEKWDRSLIEELSKVDLAFLDATFFQNGELPNRDMSEIPHPFVAETMDLLASLPKSEKKKVHFIHFNHTNPLLHDGKESEQLRAAGYNLAREGMRLPM